MAIFKPGVKFRHSRLLSKAGGKRGVVAILSLTAMVDMFTVLVVFLLPNYGEVLFIPKNVVLPQAEKIKELKPATVVTVSRDAVYIDKDSVATYDQVKAQEEWMIEPLRAKVVEALEKARKEYEVSLAKKIQDVVKAARGDEEKPEMNPWSKVTIQADKGMDFITVKKVMYTVTEAGAGEINFAVIKHADQTAPAQ